MIGLLEFGTCEITSLNDLSAFNFNYYPNPAQDRLNLKSSSIITSVDVLSVTGQHILHIDPLSNKTHIDISNFKSGTYFIKVQIENKIELCNFFKN